MEGSTYSNFDLQIEPWEAKYRARVVASPVDGSATSWFSFPEQDRSPQLWDSDVKLKAFGQRLFERVFDDNVRDQLQRSLAEALRQGAEGVRLRLRLADVPELATLPWEYLYDAAQDQFLCLSKETPVVRFLDLPSPRQPLPVKPPLRILVVISSPVDWPPLDVGREWAKVEKALQPLVDAERIVLKQIEEATLSMLQRTLRREEYHVFHFIGHGDFDQASGDGRLVLEDDEGRGHLVGSRHLGTLLHDERTLRLAILNACEGGRVSGTDPFSGVVQGLLRRGIPAVIAMQDVISDPAAMTFAAEFYAALADGYPVDASLTEARKAIYFAGNEVEWGTPVFYMRLPDGRVFDIP